MACDDTRLCDNGDNQSHGGFILEIVRILAGQDSGLKALCHQSGTRVYICNHEFHLQRTLLRRIVTLSSNLYHIKGCCFAATYYAGLFKQKTWAYEQESGLKAFNVNARPDPLKPRYMLITQTGSSRFYRSHFKARDFKKLGFAIQVLAMSCFHEIALKEYPKVLE
ncbi:hypothetical protein Tco_0327077 [Tanacetum coccineum]